MRSPARSTLLAAALVVVLLGMPTAGAAPRAGGPASASDGLVTDAVPVPPGAHANEIPAADLLRLTATLSSPRAPELSQLLAALQDPASPEYRHFLTEAQYEASFAPPSSADAEVASYFAGFGATGFAVTSDRFAISFDLPAGALPAALGVTAVSWGPALGYTSVGSAHLPAPIASLVAGIGGLSDTRASSFSPLVREIAPGGPRGTPLHEFVDGLGGQPWFIGSDLTQASGTARLFPGGSVGPGTFPTHEAIATLLMSGYNQTSNQDLPPFDPVVVQQYFNDTFPASWPQPNVSGVPVAIDGITPPLPGYYNGTNDTTLDETENSLDLEMAGSLAPGADLVNFYFAGSLLAAPTSNPSDGDIADDFGQTLEAALTHNYSPASLVAVSASFGLPDLNDALWDTELENAAATGVTVLAASGDQADAPNYLSGRSQGQWPGWPASAAFDTYGAVSVGGFSFSMSGSPNGTYYSNGTLNVSFDPAPGAFQQLGAWYDTAGGPGNVSGTEGGISGVYSEPGWQLDSAAQPTIVNVTVAQGATSLGRAEPDVAFPAYGLLAYVARDSGGTYYALLEGTSIAAPVFAGMLASVAAVRGAPFGFLTPELYRIGSFYAAFPSPGADPFLDVTNGSNYQFSAAPGWDGATGWGTVYAPWFVAADANVEVRNYTYTGPTPGLPPPFFSYTGPPTTFFLVFVGAVGALAVVAIILIARPRRPAAPPPGYGPPAPPPPGPGTLPSAAPWPGAVAPAPPPYGALPPPTFLCPYCGGPRPAEPVRCPSCGRY